jgi:hypothetical protein
MLYWVYTAIETNSTLFLMNIILAPIGIMANLLSIYIFNHKMLNNKTHIGFLHSLLCVYNIIPFMNGILLSQVLPYFKINVAEYTHYLCKIINFWRRFAIDVSSLQQLFITIYLYLCIKHPSKFMLLQNKKYVVLIIVCILATTISLNVPFLFYELKTSKELNLTALAKKTQHTTFAMRRLIYSRWLSS